MKINIKQKSGLLLWSFIVLLILITLSDSRLGLFSIATPLKVALIFALFLGNLRVYLTGKVEIPFYKYFIPFFTIAVLSVIAANTESGRILKTVTYLLNLALIPFLVARAYCYSSKEFLKFFLYTVLGILLTGLVLKLIGFGGVTFVRYRGLLGNPNGLGLFTLFTAISFRIITYYHRDIMKRKHLWLAWGIILASLFLSNSRNSMISLGIFFIFSSNLFKYKRFLQLGTAAIAVISFSFLSQQAFQIISAYDLQEQLRVESLEDMQSGSGRKIAHDFAKQYISNNFWFGEGIGTTEQVFKEFGRELSDEGHQGNAHNSFFTIWMDTGVIGLVLFCLAWFIIFLKAEKLTGFGFPIMLTVAFSAYYESYLAAFLNPFTTLLLVILSLLTIPEFSRRKEEETEETIQS